MSIRIPENPEAAAAAAYLEGRLDRIATVRVILARLNHELSTCEASAYIRRRRLNSRIHRLLRYLSDNAA
ncbi:hypothetical protein [Nocardiopsis sp. NPDC057823]|uniref:hypothetical protein n=1 Tax=Nocardiopsis sp. NPDC057823 TaxID=3346256 RepID=UPI00366DEE74